MRVSKDGVGAEERADSSCGGPGGHRPPPAGGGGRAEPPIARTDPIGAALKSCTGRPAGPGVPAIVGRPGWRERGLWSCHHPARASSAREHLCLAGGLGGRAPKESEPLPRSIPTVSAPLLRGTGALPTSASTIGCPRPIGPCPESTGSARSARARTLSSARGWWKALGSPQGAIFPVPTSPIIAETQHGRGSATPTPRR
jgi:hypothetical protein